jgi:hypothetical protein
MIRIKVTTKKYKTQIKQGINPVYVARKIATIHAVNNIINRGN